MTCDTAIMAVAALLGPVVAVALSLLGQSRMQKSQNAFQEKLMQSVEAARRDWEMKRADSHGKYEDAWNVAMRDKCERLIKALEKLAGHAEPKC